MTETPIAPMDSLDQPYFLGVELIDAVLGAVEDENRYALADLLDPLHPADIADLVEQISSFERASLVRLWGHSFDIEVISELEDSLRAEVVDLLPRSVLRQAVRDLETDDVVDIVEDLAEAKTSEVLDALEDVDRIAVEQSLQYPEETAGRLMQRELVMAPSHFTVGMVIDHLRVAKDLPDKFYDVVMVDPRLQPVGKVPLSSLMSHDRSTPITAIADEDFMAIPVEQSQEDVAYAFNQYNLVSAPVVNSENRLVGVITIDDAMEVLEEEAEEDIMRLAGLGDEALTDSIAETTKQRFPWLAVNLATSILASLVIAQFAETIETLVALAILMPIVASMGGNAGTQTLTVAVRAIATKDLTSANAWRVIRREVAVGFLNGCLFAIIMGVVGALWFSEPMLGVVIGLAMIGNLLVAGLAGIFIPISLEKLGIDPALASGAFVTTVTDIVGFFAFLGLAAVLLL